MVEEEEEKEAEYHSHDFEWEELRQQVEADPSLSYHLSPFYPSSSSSSSLSPPASDAWRDFHRRHSTGKFFKERRYLLKEFPELLGSSENATVLEVGCGNGSTVLPILRARQSITVYACDCSEDILEKTKEILYAAKGVSIENRFHPFLLDISAENFPDWLFCRTCQISSFQKATSHSIDSSRQRIGKECPASMGQKRCCIRGVDFLTLIFTLSAIPFDKMLTTIERCASVLKPGGLLLFRDYGVYDMSMLRFLPDQRVGFREYMRSDGTVSCFFSLDAVRDLFCAAGLTELELEYCCIRSVNRKNGKTMRRVWVHGKFEKPLS